MRFFVSPFRSAVKLIDMGTELVLPGDLAPPGEISPGRSGSLIPVSPGVNTSSRKLQKKRGKWSQKAIIKPKQVKWR